MRFKFKKMGNKIALPINLLMAALVFETTIATFGRAFHPYFWVVLQGLPKEKPMDFPCANNCGYQYCYKG